MRFLFVRVQPRKRAGTNPAEVLAQQYLARVAGTHSIEAKEFPDETYLSENLERASRRTRPVLILTDSRGQNLTSEQIAERLGRYLDSGAQEIVLAVGPPDGWSPALLARADLTLSFGRITLPHELAAVILAEQTYRALAILAGHPYHRGH